MWFFKEGGVIPEKKQWEMMEQFVKEARKRFDHPIKKVLLLPPDVTRYFSGAGKITNMLYHILSPHCHIDIIPTLGQHVPHTPIENHWMFGDIPDHCFSVHNWLSSCTLLGKISKDYVKYISNDRADWEIPVEINRKVLEDKYDLIVNIGQIVPHEVLGFANHNKNYFIGLGGKSTICASHMMAACCGIEDNLGQIITPLRSCYMMAEMDYLKNVPSVYILIVKTSNNKGKMDMTGLYIGEDIQTYITAVQYARERIIYVFEKPLKKVICMMDEMEFKSTWVTNKAIYRTRKVVADGGELLIIAPGVERFGEQKDVDLMIRRYGYKGTRHIMDAYKSDPKLHNLGHAAAHLIHGSSEGRFRITYATGKLTGDELTGAGFDYMDINRAIKNYRPYSLKNGLNMVNGEEIYFISSPSLGLWTTKEKFFNSLNANLTFANRMIAIEPDEPVWKQLLHIDMEDIVKYKI
jgi:nickel-dependent lactate racemase